MIRRHPLLFGTALAIAIVVVLSGAVICHFGTIPNAFYYLQGHNYIVSPITIDVGNGRRGDERATTTTVRNLSFSPIRVIGAVTTCNCLVVSRLPVTITPGQAADIQFTIYFESARTDVEQIANLLVDDGQMQRTPVTVRGACLPSE